ncbi:CHAT domain-containing protein [Microtetraspora glauca]|uniref:CHAT domain-containing protein n=1 Tax=Microtetraspora glauca TaxID=1996 RepID=A0ABV3GIA8_MICGL
MNFDEMHGVRDRWIEDLISSVIDTLDEDPSNLVPTFVFRTGIGRLPQALTVVRIALLDSIAIESTSIAEELQSHDLTAYGLAAADVRNRLVLPVIRRFRVSGAPWARWWDVAGLFEALVELWTAERLLVHSSTRVRHELRTIWKVQDERKLDCLLKCRISPYAYLPEDVLEEGPLSIPAQILQKHTRHPLTIDLDEQVRQRHPEFGNRPDLMEVLRRSLLRVQLEARLTRLPGWADSSEDEFTKEIVNAFTAWDNDFARCMQSMTAHEVELLQEHEPERIRRNIILSAARDYSAHIPADLDVLSSSRDLQSEPAYAAPWIVDKVVVDGARSWHASTGPLSAWFIAAETDDQEIMLRRLLASGSFGLGCGIRDTTVQLRINLSGSSDEEEPPLEVPFFYRMSQVGSAWELLLMSAVGRVRLVGLRLTPDGEVRVVGANSIELPKSLIHTLETNSLNALRNSVGDDMEKLRHEIETCDVAEVSLELFMACELAKAEDLLEELTALSPVNVDSIPWTRFRQASRALANARADRAATAADGGDPEKFDQPIKRAIESRQRALEVARTWSPKSLKHDNRLRSLVASLPDSRTSFAHLMIKNEKLYLLTLVQSPEPLIEWRYLRVSVADLLMLCSRWTTGTAQQRREMISDGSMLPLRDIAKSVISALPPETGVRRLILSPVAPLDLLPLHAIPIDDEDDTAGLLDYFDEITHAPTLAIAAKLAQATASPSGYPLIVAQLGGHLPDLPLLKMPVAEAAIFSVLYQDARELVAGHATRNAVIEAMSGAKVVHIACHTLFTGDRWGDGLILDGRSLGSALLSAGHIMAETDLRGAELVVLSSCHTAGHASLGSAVQTVRGLEAAFLARGARAVISSLWSVSDIPALVFSTVLHANIAGGATVGQAYSGAIKYLRSRDWNLVPPAADAAHMISPERWAEVHLDLCCPDWRILMDRHADDGVAMWGTFKLSGAAWR